MSIDVKDTYVSEYVEVHTSRHDGAPITIKLFDYREDIRGAQPEHVCGRIMSVIDDANSLPTGPIITEYIHEFEVLLKREQLLDDTWTIVSLSNIPSRLMTSLQNNKNKVLQAMNILDSDYLGISYDNRYLRVQYDRDMDNTKIPFHKNIVFDITMQWYRGEANVLWSNDVLLPCTNYMCKARNINNRNNAYLKALHSSVKYLSSTGSVSSDVNIPEQTIRIPMHMHLSAMAISPGYAHRWQQIEQLKRTGMPSCNMQEPMPSGHTSNMHSVPIDPMMISNGYPFSAMSGAFRPPVNPFTNPFTDVYVPSSTVDPMKMFSPSK